MADALVALLARWPPLSVLLAELEVIVIGRCTIYMLLLYRRLLACIPSRAKINFNICCLCYRRASFSIAQRRNSLAEPSIVPDWLLIWACNL